MFIIGNWPIANSQFDVRFLLDCLRGHDPDCNFTDDSVVQVMEPDEKEISQGRGVASAIVRVRLHLRIEKSRNTRLTKTLIIKIPNDEFFKRSIRVSKVGYSQKQIEALEKEKREMLAGAHATEIRFYEFISSARVPLRVPRYYKGLLWNFEHDRQGVIVMEDVSETGKHHTISNSLTVEQVKCVVEEIVKLQSASFVHRDILEAFPLDERVMRATSDFVELCIDELHTKHDWFSDTLTAKLKRHSSVEALKEKLSWTPQRGLRAVLVHGDLWPNNMLWKKRTLSDSDLLAAIIDFQCVHAGNYTTDLAGLLAVNVHGELRRKMEEEVLQYYCKRMGQECSSVGFPFDVAFETVRENYRRSLMYSVFQVIMTVVTNPGDDIPYGASGPALTNSLRLLIDDIDSLL